ncbi:radical SAM family heme chaperone HemW [Marinigracilibium pacificum]|uniref:Heme chaperone HemW n=1 Tax=Marinigracilibium pacificum TaxID=2729599 RepID=A0A848IRP6_9BACT|nr:radical SAM family heme chaperone HemW [Marinigracilibium pacificum]NMM47143.1 radical SAM family heme chaperone HemW [Marinigracilibium pacificum]
MSGIYIHIPFCKQACHYCDFHFSTNLKNIDALVDAMLTEINLRKDFFKDAEIKTLYFGGGTPSTLNQKNIDAIINELNSSFTLPSNLSEFTFEANPDDITKQKLLKWKISGVDRLSIGIQSFNEEILKFLNRAHNAEMAVKALEDCKNTGFNRFSLDLIYGIPGRNLNEWRKDVEKALSYNPEHISAYSLTIEEKTVFGNWLKKGRIKPMEDNDVIDQYLLLVQILEDHGYEHYEVSNFAKPGCRAVHNTSYWNAIPYLGIGPSAHSFKNDQRFWNVSNNAKYISSLKSGILPIENEVLSIKDQMNEYLMTKLRLIEGIDTIEFKNRFGSDIMKDHENYFQEISSAGLGEFRNNFYKLTTRGKLFADEIASNLFY